MRGLILMLVFVFVSMQTTVCMLDFYGLVSLRWLDMLWPLWLFLGLFMTGTVLVVVLGAVVISWEGYREKQN